MSIALQTRVRADVPELQSIVFVVEVGVGDEGEERHCDLKLQYPCKATPKMTFFAKMLYKRTLLRPALLFFSFPFSSFGFSFIENPIV